MDENNENRGKEKNKTTTRSTIISLGKICKYFTYEYFFDKIYNRTLN